MKPLLLALLLVVGARAQIPSPFTFYIHDTTGHLADTPLPLIYQLNSTVVGNGSPLVIKAINSSTNTASLTVAYVSSDPNTYVSNPNFLLSGLYHGLPLAPQGSAIFTVNFSPLAAGIITGYLQLSYQVQQLNCDFSASSPCPSGIVTASALTGTATSPSPPPDKPLAPPVLSYTDSTGASVTPQAGTQISFGNIPTSATKQIQFTVTNQNTAAVDAPAVSIVVPQFSTAAYVLDTSQLIGPLMPNGGSATFSITFAPGQTGTAPTTSLMVSSPSTSSSPSYSNSYNLLGSGSVSADIDALQIAYVKDSVRTPAQGATPIKFADITAGSGSSSTLSFCVTNPLSSYDPVTPTVAVAGAGFAIASSTAGSTLCNSTPCPSLTLPVTIPSGTASSFTASISPCQASAFNLTFTPGLTTVGASNGTISFADSSATRTFALSANTLLPPIPALSFQVAPLPLGSNQQPTITANLATPISFKADGALKMSFAPLFASATDSAIGFTSPVGQTQFFSFQAGSQQSPTFTFQTGTTAGTLTFTTDSFVNTNPYTQSFVIPPAPVQIAITSTALRQSPNLVVTLNGYDNTYSATQLSFQFYDTAGNAIGSAIPYDATSKFKTFFGATTTGSAFILQAVFPVTGDVTKVGSVAVALTNSAGQTTTTQNFQ